MSIPEFLNQIPFPTERTERYHCGICNETFERSYPRRLMCGVIHPPGTCCHYGDTVITKRQLQKERELQQAVEQERKEATSELSNKI